jgi:hypothetical protein
MFLRFARKRMITFRHQEIFIFFLFQLQKAHLKHKQQNLEGAISLLFHLSPFSLPHYFSCLKVFLSLSLFAFASFRLENRSFTKRRRQQSFNNTFNSTTKVPPSNHVFLLLLFIFFFFFFDARFAIVFTGKGTQPSPHFTKIWFSFLVCFCGYIVLSHFAHAWCLTHSYIRPGIRAIT